jgi:hypothetical protein
MTLVGTATGDATTEPGTGVRLLAAVTIVWCIGFAVVNVVFEVSGRFADGPLAGYGTGLAVMEWLVVGLKLLGALTAALTVAEWPRRVPSSVRTVLVWGAFALLALYSGGNLVKLVGFLATAPEQVTPRLLAYVAFFAAGAIGYGVLAVSYFRRSGRNRRSALVGVLGAPVVLGLLLGVAPAVLAAAGLLPA